VPVGGVWIGPGAVCVYKQDRGGNSAPCSLHPVPVPPATSTPADHRARAYIKHCMASPIYISPLSLCTRKQLALGDATGHAVLHIAFAWTIFSASIYTCTIHGRQNGSVHCPWSSHRRPPTLTSPGGPRYITLYTYIVVGTIHCQFAVILLVAVLLED